MARVSHILKELIGVGAMAKILQFPKSKSTRAQVIQRSLNQKAVIPLSLLSVLVVTLSLNEWIQVASNKINNTRGVASLPAETIEKQIKWEHRWAESLQKANARPGLTAEEPRPSDQLLFGLLQGDVKLKRQNGHISELEMINPVELKNREEFLESFREVWSVKFAKVEFSREKSDANQETYTLLDSKGQAVGSAVFGLESLESVKKLQFLTPTK